jgi:hypothetical protein
MYKKSSRDERQKIFLGDAPCGSLIGHATHCYPEMGSSVFDAVTSEKTKLLKFDLEGFNRFFLGYLNDKHNKIIQFIQTMGILRRTRS